MAAREPIHQGLADLRRQPLGCQAGITHRAVLAVRATSLRCSSCRRRGCNQSKRSKGFS